jgi:hypothetical protein
MPAIHRNTSVLRKESFPTLWSPTNIPINAYIIGANEHESHYVFDILFNNTTDIQPEIHSTDTHGANEVNFALLHLFGYRIRATPLVGVQPTDSQLHHLLQRHAPLQAAAHKESRGDMQGAALVKQASPVTWQHINLYGRYEFRKQPEPVNGRNRSGIGIRIGTDTALAA